MQMSTDLTSRRQQVRVLRQLPTRARMVRDIVANDAATGFDSRRPLKFAPADGPVDGLLSRRCWFESNSGRHTRADGSGGDLLSRQHVSSSLTAGAAKLTGISIPG